MALRRPQQRRAVCWPEYRGTLSLNQAISIYDYTNFNLKYADGAPIIRHLERVSKPGRRTYVGVNEIPRVRNGLGMAILSTSTGLVSDRVARQKGVGGELMALIW